MEGVSDQARPYPEERELSRILFPLGAQLSEFCESFDQFGLGAGARAWRDGVEDFAGSDEARRSLWTYWVEHAKECISRLNGAYNPFTGVLPDFSAYRSPFLEDLRRQAATRFAGVPHRISPQIEPTLQRYFDRISERDLRTLAITSAARRARALAASLMNYSTMPGFGGLSGPKRYELLVDRYSKSLFTDSFRLDSDRQYGLIYRKTTSCGRWDFFFADVSDCETSGLLNVELGLALPCKRIVPNSMTSSAAIAASFTPRCMLPGHAFACRYFRSSYAEFCLAVDVHTHMARSMYQRVDRLLNAPD